MMRQIFTLMEMVWIKKQLLLFISLIMLLGSCSTSNDTPTDPEPADVTTFTLTIFADNGTVIKDPDSAEYSLSAQVQLSANPASGYSFDHWSGDVTGTANPITIQIDANKTVTAHFIIQDDGQDDGQDESFEQPEVPGPIDTSIVQDFPPLEEIVNKPVQDVPLFGLYAWVNYFGNWWGLTTHADSVGWKTIRVGGLAGTGTDDYITNMVNSGYEILAPLSAPNGDTRADFASDNEFITAYLTYLDEIIGRYGPNGSFWQNHSDTAFHPGGDKYHPIIYWEIYNEPNEHYMFYPNSATMTEKAALYAKLLVAAHDHIRGNSDWDDIKIVGFSASGVSRNDLWAPESPGHIGFVEMVHQNILDNTGNNPGNYYDIISTHPYVHDAPPDSENIETSYHYSIANSFMEYLDIMNNFGVTDKPVWFTEVGWNRDYGQSGNDVSPVSERIQAAYACRLYLTALRLGVERVHIMFAFDHPDMNGGFFTYDLNADPPITGWYEQAYAVQHMISRMPKPKLTGAISDGIDGYYAYTINPNTDTLENDIIVAWHVAGEVTVDIPCEPGQYTIYDMLGGSQVLTAASDQLTVNIGPCPIYIVAYNDDTQDIDTEALIIDHTRTQIDQIPLSAIEQAKDTLHIVYGHTSHGQQLIEGTRNLDAFMTGRGYPTGTFSVNFEDTAASGELDFNDTPWRRLGWSEYGRDLGSKALSDGGLDDGDYTAWLYTTRKYLGWTPLPGNDGSQLDHYAAGTPNYDGSANVVIWSWCGQVSYAPEAEIQNYLDRMSQLELDYPEVKFVYMTGHLDGTGLSGTLHRRNDIIRQYCLDNNKILYDFEDIESWDPDGNYYGDKLVSDACNYDYDEDGVLEETVESQTGETTYPDSANGWWPKRPLYGDRNWALDWQEAHPTQWYSCSIRYYHTQHLNHNLKAYAAWYLFARLAGWDGTP